MERYVPQGDFYVTLSNGTNNDVGGNYTASRIRFTGLTGVATVTGLTLGHPGRVLFLHNDTAYVITLPHNNAGSVAANRFGTRRLQSFFLQPGQIACGVYDGVNLWWEVVDSEDVVVDSSGNVKVAGSVTERGYAAAMGVFTHPAPTRFTSTAATWTAGTVATFKYSLIGKQMTIIFEFAGTSVSAGGAQLRFTIPGGFTAAAGSARQLILSNDNGAGWVAGSAYAPSGQTYIELYSTAAFGGYAASVLNTSVAGQITLEVQ